MAWPYHVSLKCILELENWHSPCSGTCDCDKEHECACWCHMERLKCPLDNGMECPDRDGPCLASDGQNCGKTWFEHGLAIAREKLAK